MAVSWPQAPRTGPDGPPRRPLPSWSCRRWPATRRRDRGPRTKPAARHRAPRAPPSRSRCETVDARSLVGAVDTAAAVTEVAQHRRREVAHPLVDRLVAPGAAQRGRRGQPQQSLEAVAAPVAAARSVMVRKTSGRLLICSALSMVPAPMTVAGLQGGSAKHATGVPGQGTYEDLLRRGACAVPAPDAAEAARHADLGPARAPVEPTNRDGSTKVSSNTSG